MAKSVLGMLGNIIDYGHYMGCYDLSRDTMLSNQSYDGFIEKSNGYIGSREIVIEIGIASLITKYTAEFDCGLLSAEIVLSWHIVVFSYLNSIRSASVAKVPFRWPYVGSRHGDKERLGQGSVSHGVDVCS